MMAVEAPLGHPNDPVINRRDRRDSRDSVDDELDRVLDGKQVRGQKAEGPEGPEGTRDYRGTDLPVRSHTPDHRWDGRDGRDGSSEEDHSGTQSPYDDDYSPTEHQQTAMTELQQLKLELGYIEDEPPVYDVADRLKQLNQELAEDPTPIDDDRERSIKFKDDLVDLVAPPPDYEPYESEDDTPRVRPEEKQLDKGGEESGEKESQKEEPSQSDPLRNPAKPNQEENNAKQIDQALDDIKLHKMSLSSSQDNPDTDVDGVRNNESNNHSEGSGEGEPYADDDSRAASAAESINGTQNSHSDYGSDTEDPEPKQTSAKKDEEKVLVEINGKFELLSREEVKARGVAHLLPPDDNSPRSDSTASSSSFQPAPPRDPRPRTAAEGGARRRMTSAPPRRAHSANPGRTQVNHGSGLEDFNYNSPYALTPAQKKYLKHRQKQNEERQREERERQKEEEEQKKRANNEIFESWLASKRRQMAKERQERGKHGKEQKEQEDKEKQDPYDDDSFTSGSLNEREKQEAFNAWLRTKQEQKKQDKFFREHQQKEIDEGWYSHSKEENDKAFRRWLRKKNAERRKSGRDEYQKVRMQKLQERRTRKAMALVRAIKQSQSFKYVDYYGYRN